MESEAEHESEAETSQTQIIPIKELRNQPLRSALKSCIVSKVSSKYQVIAVRALINTNTELWKVRRIMEETLTKDHHVVGFISCGTALTQTANKEVKNVPGISFWIIFDWPEHGLSAYESHVSKIFLKENLNLLACKAIRSRSK